MAMPLTMFNSGSNVKIKCIQGGKNVCSRLNALGICCNTNLCLVEKDGCLTVKFNNSKIAIGFGIAHKIMCEEV